MSTPNEIRQDITNRIVAALKAGRIPWQKPWTNQADPVRLPTNFVSKKHYTGINILTLWMAAEEKGYPASYWATFKQWKAVGASVRKGERATTLIFYKPVSKSVRDDNGRLRLETFPLLKTWSVFNIAQVAGKVAEEFAAKPVSIDINNLTFDDPNDVDRDEFERLVAATGADVRYGFNKAAYVRPPHDYIMMPHERQFGVFGNFSATMLHELAHWSEHRVGWKGTYAEGELRAEIAASFLTNALNLPGSTDLANHATFVQGWLESLENDPKHIFRASAAASKAADYLLSFVRPHDEPSEDEHAAFI